MTRDEFDAALREMGWTSGAFAKRLGLHKNAVSAWGKGDRPVPEYAAAYLRLALAVKGVVKEIE